jgi:hypothetical protein
MACCPVSIPLEDITLNYAGTGFAGNGSIAMVYTPAVGFTPASWASGCLDVGTIDVGSGPFHAWFKFQLSCSTPGQTSLHYDVYGNSTCTGSPTALGSALTIASFSGTPFHLHNDPSIFAPLVAAGFTSLDYDSPTNVTGACKYKFNVEGCNFIAAEGVTVSAWTSAAKTTLLGTGTTDSSGDILIVSTERTTNGHYEITGSRFTSLSGNGLLSSATSTNNFSLTATASYHCDSGICGWPIAGTLHMTHPVFGAVTLTYSSGHWTGTKAYSYPGNIAGGGSCAGATVTVSFDMDEGYGYTESWPYDGSDCPTDSGTNTATAFWTFEGVDCYVPSVTAFSANFSKTPFAGPQENLYGSSFLNLSITE